MTTDVGQNCYGWSLEDLADQDDSQKISVSQMLNHGSISFGRFALEPLSWEKRSVFSHNRYQEELERFRAPGLVAQKKAYFEEHYKRIRAMKVLEENQHAEPASCYSGGSGKSEQTREEDLRVVPKESHEDEMEDTVGSGIEKTPTETNLDLDGESALVEPDSPGKLSKDKKKGQPQFLDRNSHNYSEHDDFIRLDNEQEPWRRRLNSISGQTGEANQRAGSNEIDGVELKNTIGACTEGASTKITLEIGGETAFLEIDSPTTSSKDSKKDEKPQISHDHECMTTSIKDSNQPYIRSLYNKEISKKSENEVQNDSVFPPSSPSIFEIMLEVEQKKVNSVVKACKESALTSDVMERSSPVGGFCKLEYKTPFTFMKTQAVKDPSQMRSGKNSVGIVSCKRTVDRILCSKHASAVSHGSPKEMRSKVTAPRSFSFAAEKRAVAFTSSASPRSDAKNLLSSSPHPKNNNSKVAPSKAGIPLCQKSEKLESKRGYEEVGRKFFAFNRHDTHLKAGCASNVRTLKASYNGDAKDGTNSNRLRRINGDGKWKIVEEANNETCLKESGGHGKPAIFHSHSRNQNSENIKLPSSRIRDLSLNTKKSCLVRRKPCPDKPRWR